MLDPSFFQLVEASNTSLISFDTWTIQNQDRLRTHNCQIDTHCTASVRKSLNCHCFILIAQPMRLKAFLVLFLLQQLQWSWDFLGCHWHYFGHAVHSQLSTISNDKKDMEFLVLHLIILKQLFLRCYAVTHSKIWSVLNSQSNLAGRIREKNDL